MSDEDLQRPTRFVPQLTAREESAVLAQQDHEIGLRYWEWLGMRDSSMEPDPLWSSVWATSTTALAEEFGETAGRLYLIAAATVEAVLAEVECPRCVAPVALKSRTALDQIARGAEPQGRCARCDERLQGEVAKYLDPVRRATRAEKRQATLRLRAEQDERNERLRQAAEELRDLGRRRREAVLDTYPLALTGHAASEPSDLAGLGTSFRIEAATLALLDHSPATAPIPAPLSWDVPLAPNQDMIHTVVDDAFGDGLIRIHPGGRLDGFVWSAEDSATITDRFYPLRADWYVAHGGATMADAADVMRTWLRGRTRDWLSTTRGVEDAAALAAQLIVAETMRYLDFQLKEHHLPAVPEHHRARLQEHAERLAQDHSLGQCYSVAWRAARNAASMIRRFPGAPAENASAHAVNTFEEMVTRATGDASYELDLYRLDSRCPLSGLTKTLMVTILEVDPMAATVPGIVDTLRSAPGFPRCWSLDARGASPEDDLGPGNLDGVADPATHSGSASPAALAALLKDALAEFTPRSSASELAAGQDANLELNAGPNPEPDLIRDSGPVLDLGQLDEWLIAGAEPLIESYDLHESGHDLVVDALDRLTALRAVLDGTSAVEVVKTVLSLAFLMPGSVETNHGDVEPLGRVLGYEIVWTLGLNGDF